MPDLLRATLGFSWLKHDACQLSVVIVCGKWVAVSPSRFRSTMPDTVGGSMLQPVEREILASNQGNNATT